MAAEGGTNVPGIERVDVGSMDDVARALSDGERHRTVGKTNCNEHSSRSHMILSVFVKCSNLATGKTNCNEHSPRSHMILSVFVKCSNLATGGYQES
ncbi:hypothetical protein T484DRAFT_1792220 [Baffinella frigidus]|nr:hypothetical protein T484DRAFT_1792220 [Cryptophyta sp. CCMP2293]